MNAKQALLKASQRISGRDAETLLIFAAGQNRAWLLAHPETELSAEQQARFEAMVDRRAAQEPLQYVTGFQEFFGLVFAVSRDVLIPRPETELLVEAVLEWVAGHGAPHPMRIVDVGTGSGAIALTLAHRLPGASVTALDLSEAALDVAQRNAMRLGLRGTVDFVQSDLLAAVERSDGAQAGFDVVVSNPPYVPSGDAEQMQPEVRDFEPHLALFAGDDGLAVYRRLIPQAQKVLRPGGLLAMEFGFGQRAALETLLADWNDVQFRDDYAGIPRIALARCPVT
jgi:release factor glutamine methyltransferase